MHTFSPVARALPAARLCFEGLTGAIRTLSSADAFQHSPTHGAQCFSHDRMPPRGPARATGDAGPAMPGDPTC